MCARSEGRCLPVPPLCAHTFLLGPFRGREIKHKPCSRCSRRRPSPPSAGSGRGGGAGSGRCRARTAPPGSPAGRSRLGALAGLRMREHGLSPPRGPWKAAARTGQLQPARRCPLALLPAAILSRPSPGTAALVPHAPAAGALPPAHTTPHPAAGPGRWLSPSSP